MFVFGICKRYETSRFVQRVMGKKAIKKFYLGYLSQSIDRYIFPEQSTGAVFYRIADKLDKIGYISILIGVED